MVCDWCGEVWAEGNWLQRGAGIEGVIHGVREGKERKRCRARERGCRWQGSWGSGLVIDGDARVQQRCSRDTGSVRSHFGTWYAASGWKTLPFSLLPLSLSAWLLSSSAHDDEETTTPRRTRVIMLIFMAAPLWSVAAASSPSWSRLGHRRRADSFPSHLTVTSPHVLNFFFSFFFVSSPKNPLHSSTRVLVISLRRAAESPSHKQHFHAGSEFLFLTSHNPPSHNYLSHHAQNFSSFWTQPSFLSKYMLNISFSPLHVSSFFFPSSYLSWDEYHHFIALQPSFNDFSRSFPSPAESYPPKCAKFPPRCGLKLPKKGVDSPFSWTPLLGTSSNSKKLSFHVPFGKPYQKTTKTKSYTFSRQSTIWYLPKTFLFTC